MTMSVRAREQVQSARKPTPNPPTSRDTPGISRRWITSEQTPESTPIISERTPLSARAQIQSSKKPTPGCSSRPTSRDTPGISSRRVTSERTPESRQIMSGRTPLSARGQIQGGRKPTPGYSSRPTPRDTPGSSSRRVTNERTPERQIVSERTPLSARGQIQGASSSDQPTLKDTPGTRRITGERTPLSARDAEYSDIPSDTNREDLLLEKLSTISNALNSVVKRLDKTESRLSSVEQKLKPSSSSSESPSSKKRMVPTIVKVHAV